MNANQPGILGPGCALGRFLTFERTGPEAWSRCLDALSGFSLGTDVLGLGHSFLGTDLDSSLRGFPLLEGGGVSIPSTQNDLWLWLRGEDRGDLVHRTHTVTEALSVGVRLVEVVDTFMHLVGETGLGRDLTGYEDGTENPQGDAAIASALVQGEGPGLDGSSFVAAQKWRHDLSAFGKFSTSDQDHLIGRRRSDNVELEDAPESAHVKRTAQESFDPEAFLLRKSMPWADPTGEGLMFVAFGKNLDAFEAQLRRMAGLEDGIVDGLFRFSKPETGGYYWCPPVREGKPDLRILT